MQQRNALPRFFSFSSSRVKVKTHLTGIADWTQVRTLFTYSGCRMPAWVGKHRLNEHVCMQEVKARPGQRRLQLTTSHIAHIASSLGANSRAGLICECPPGCRRQQSICRMSATLPGPRSLHGNLCSGYLKHSKWGRGGGALARTSLIKPATTRRFCFLVPRKEAEWEKMLAERPRDKHVHARRHSFAHVEAEK